ncbi:MAG: lipoprotein transmembrane [Glaciimonas sp.]|nr:lipoprotein transmembrane [Glaciimonas sp.]
MIKNLRITRLLTLGCLVMGLCQSASAVEIAGVKLDETVHVANTELKLNGAGIRVKAIFKVYVAGLYLPTKKTTVPEILDLAGPRRLTLVMLREVSSEEFGQSFMTGLNANSDKAEKSKIVNQTVKMGEIFASIPSIKKGDTITSDWVPGSGMLIHVNGKQVGEVIPGMDFYNAYLKIWLGDKPADSSLKQSILGGKG